MSLYATIVFGCSNPRATHLLLYYLLLCLLVGVRNLMMLGHQQCIQCKWMAVMPTIKSKFLSNIKSDAWNIISSFTQMVFLELLASFKPYTNDQ